jgi:hypothetical protein
VEGGVSKGHVVRSVFAFKDTLLGACVLGGFGKGELPLGVEAVEEVEV